MDASVSPSSTTVDVRPGRPPEVGLVLFGPVGSAHMVIEATARFGLPLASKRRYCTVTVFRTPVKWTPVPQPNSRTAGSCFSLFSSMTVSHLNSWSVAASTFFAAPERRPAALSRPTPSVSSKSSLADSESEPWPMYCIGGGSARSEEHTSELQSHLNLVCRLLLEKKKKKKYQFFLSKKKRKKK